MSNITLIRHGQANTGARDEISYDCLSELGHQQASWLGEHLRETESATSRLYCGTLTRHIQTATAMGMDDGFHQDARLNEIEYFTLAKLLKVQQGVAIPTEREGFISHLPMVFSAWQDGLIKDPPESFQTFEDRVAGTLDDISQGEGPALVVTSGGLIAMVMRSLLGLDIPATARVALAIMNTSMHRFHTIGETLSPVLFNAVPHLDVPDRHFAQTHL
ncbi:MAG: histidine phosphatase family protein [Paracoccaceae bacterium]